VEDEFLLPYVIGRIWARVKTRQLRLEFGA
jgi:hypothetical protein